jgi:D-tyrosyl-tRNA(Tyr) deacylase
MRVVIQRVERASVEVENKTEASIANGLLVFVGIEEADALEDVKWLAGKISRLRVFPDKEGVMNLSVCDTNGEILVISQFTLHASTKKGNRPAYIKAARPEIAIPIYEMFLKQIEIETNKEVKSGVFGTMMKVSLINDGPVTIIMDTKNKE